MPQRNAASVLPLPVGALSSTWSPDAIAGQACSWAGVGPSNAPVNQLRTSGENCESGTPMRLALYDRHPGVLEDAVHHRLRELAGERVLLARVEAPQDGQRPIFEREDVVAEARARPRRGVP